MSYLNKVQLIGRLGGDPCFSRTAKSELATFSIATTLCWSSGSSSEPKTRTDWHSVKAWGALARSCSQLLKKGMTVYLEAELRYESSENQAGNNFTRAHLQLVQFQVLTWPRTNGPSEPGASSESDHLDLPF